jgi:glycosyltransferase involved in cell wall biosynthesis
MTPPAEQPSVTVITPVFNGERFIAGAIESVLAQDYDGEVEMVVVDDGSTDGSAGVVERYPGVRLIRQPNAGAAAARNAGIDASSGELIAILDCDDRMVEGRIAFQAAHLVAHPEADGSLGRQRVRLVGDTTPPRWALQPRTLQDLDPGAEIPAALPSREWAPTGPYYPFPTLTIRRTSYERSGGLDSSLRDGEDVDFLLRAFDLGLEITMFDEVLIDRLIHDGNATSGPDAARGIMVALKNRIDRRRTGQQDSGVPPPPAKDPPE